MEKLDSLNMNPPLYDQLFFDKGTITIQEVKDSFFNKCYWNSCSPFGKNKPWYLPSTLYKE